MHLDGDDKPLRITLNLSNALRQLRMRITITRIWVDALCINQEDDDEKSAQIRFMGLIYRMASSVKIWLGKYDEEAQLLRDLDQLSRHLQTVSESDVVHARKAVDGLIALPWFGRRWVIQEGVSNSNTLVLCGDASMQWIRFLKVSLRKTCRVRHCYGRFDQDHKAYLSHLSILNCP